MGCLDYISKAEIVLHITRDDLSAAKWSTLQLFVGQDNTESQMQIGFLDLREAVPEPREGMTGCVIPFKKAPIVLQWDM